MPPGIYNTEEDVKASLEILFMEYQYNCLYEKDAFACDGLGTFYSSVKDDYKTAFGLLKENCEERKYGHSCHRLAKMLSKHGSDFPAKDDPMSKWNGMHWEKKGCDFGFATSCFNYGVHLTKENGCDRALQYMYQTNDWTKDCLQVAKLGCQANALPSCEIGAQMYLKGLGGVEVNEQKARFFEKRARYLRSVEKTVFSK
ncbi:cytochrome c oxidase assembly factor 7B-like isoform X2 [Convolutriloba macropyga]|uniref:cytochrome c oxidase assembly factor 7B-like isoform X2 n=1 Tax=Convolutriloba macropyga TaxID=536237 RepID=UPI003F52649E